MTICFDRIDIYCWNIYRGNEQQLVGWIVRTQHEPFIFESYNGVQFKENEMLTIIKKWNELNEEIVVYV